MLRILSLFSGIGAFEKSLKNIGIEHEIVNYCEIDKFASKSYSLIHNIEESKNLWDITKIDPQQLPDFDLMTFGWPCQDISVIGKKQGFFKPDGTLTRSGLFYETLKILKEKQPKYAIAENVRSITFKTNKDIFESILKEFDEVGYNVRYKVLNAADYNMPQQRNRIFFVLIRKDIQQEYEWPEKMPLTRTVNELLDNPNSKYSILKHHGDCIISDKNKTNCLCSNYYKKGYDYGYRMMVKEDGQMRSFSGFECFRLMGFDTKDCQVLIDNGISNTQIYKMAGNSICVNVLSAIFTRLF